MKIEIDTAEFCVFIRLDDVRSISQDFVKVRTSESKDKFYKSLVLFHLENGTSVYQIRDYEQLNKVQI